MDKKSRERGKGGGTIDTFCSLSSYFTSCRDDASGLLLVSRTMHCCYEIVSTSTPVET